VISLSLTYSQLGEGGKGSGSTPIRSKYQRCLGRKISGGQASSSAGSGRVLGIAKSVTLPFLLHRCSGDM